MSAADHTPPRADDEQEREAPAMIPVIIAAMKGEQEEYWRDPCETRTSIALEDYAQTIAAYLTRAGFRRVAPEPVREECIGNDPQCPCQDGDTCHYRDGTDGTKAMPLPRARPEPQQQATCINCGKPRCDGHDGDSWKRCAQRHYAWAMQIERRCLALLKNHGIAPPNGLR